jgi:hypothetical protein
MNLDLGFAITTAILGPIIGIAHSSFAKSFELDSLYPDNDVNRHRAYLVYSVTNVGITGIGNPRGAIDGSVKSNSYCGCNHFVWSIGSWKSLGRAQAFHWWHFITYCGHLCRNGLACSWIMPRERRFWRQ